jgi:putative acetyltransferase
VEQIVGHIVLSKMHAPFRALGLGPIAVLPERQNKGIGSKLISEALARARADAWDGVFVVGDPAYYGRFGFNAHLASDFLSPYAGPYLMALALRAQNLPVHTGNIQYAPAFAAWS